MLPNNSLGPESINSGDGLIGEAMHGLFLCGESCSFVTKDTFLPGLRGVGLWLLAWPGKHVLRSSLKQSVNYFH